MNIKVEIEPSPSLNRPNVLAGATVTFETEVGAIRIRDCRIVQTRFGNVRFAFPNFCVRCADGRSEYRPTLELPDTIAREISMEALRAYKQGKQGGTI